MNKHFIYFVTTDPDKATLMSSLLEDATAGFNCEFQSVCYDSIYALWDELDGLTLEQQSNTLLISDPGVYQAPTPVVSGGLDEANGWLKGLKSKALYPWYELVLRYPLIMPMFLVLNGALFDDKREDLPPICYLDLALNIKEQLDNNVSLFCSGVRTWFDPFGLREHWRDKVMTAMFEEEDATGSAKQQDEDGCRLLEKLKSCFKIGKKDSQEEEDKVVLCVEDEIEYALISGYAAYKYGAQVNIINSMKTLEWAREKVGSIWKEDHIFVIRDKDLMFSDYIKDHKKDNRKTFKKLEGLFPKNAGLKNVVISSHDEENKDGDARTIQKPLESIYNVINALEEWKTAARQWRTTSKGYSKGASNSNNHAAPYLNMQLSKNIQPQATQIKDTYQDKVFIALLKLEAYMLMDRMAPTTAMQILKEMHLAELEFELSFMGVGKRQSISKRKQNVESDIKDLLSNYSSQKVLKKSFLISFWDDARVIYQKYEQFDAAEEANVEAMIKAAYR